MIYETIIKGNSRRTTQPLSLSPRSHKAGQGCKTFFFGMFHNAFHAYGNTAVRTYALFPHDYAEGRARPRIRMNMVRTTATTHPRRLARTFFIVLVVLHHGGGTLPLSPQRNLVDLLIVPAMIPEYVGKFVYPGPGSARLHPQHSRDEALRRPPPAAAMGHVAVAATFVSRINERFQPYYFELGVA